MEPSNESTGLVEDTDGLNGLKMQPSIKIITTLLIIISSCSVWMILDLSYGLFLVDVGMKSMKIVSSSAHDWMGLKLPLLSFSPSSETNQHLI